MVILGKNKYKEVQNQYTYLNDHHKKLTIDVLGYAIRKFGDEGFHDHYSFATYLDKVINEINDQSSDLEVSIRESGVSDDFREMHYYHLNNAMFCYVDSYLMKIGDE